MDREITESELILKVTELIGLGETQRRIYEDIQKRGNIDGDISKAYGFHEEELQLLIKYQKTLTSYKIVIVKKTGKMMEKMVKKLNIKRKNLGIKR